MSRISQVRASFMRSMRIFLRDKAIIGSSILIPIFFLLVLPMVLFQDVPTEFMPAVRGFLVIAMITLLIMSTAMSNLPGSIAADRDHDLYSKLSSMPVNPVYECLGRIATVFVFSGIGSVVVIALGLAIGAELVVGFMDLPLIIGLASVIVLFSSGIGLIVAGVVKSESAAAHVGVAIVLLNYFIGIAFPYRDLPDLLKPIVHVNPICLGNNMIAALSVGEEFVGYNPFNFIDITVMILLTAILFIVGLKIYSRCCWRR
ncbi:ABC transporter permease [Candidatus Thorarchaeota archaeon]|nr:MAG: ABC transporter permease [Candidatus Thorarchaeota archaeon]